MIAIVGAGGQLGTAFAQLLGDAAIALVRDDLDVTDPGAIRDVLEGMTPSAVVNCAAYTDVDRAEDEPDRARALNATAVRDMARVCSDLEVPFLTFSTDYVFDGRKDTAYAESDPPNPISVYGESKLEGETFALDEYGGSLVVRTSWLLSGTHPNFASMIVRLAREGTVKVIADQRGRPTLVDDLAVASLAALRSSVTGILHLTNGPTVTWHDLARECVKIAGGDTTALEPCLTADFPTRAHRPSNSVLNSERQERLGLDPLPSFRAGLSPLIESLVANVVD